MIVSGPNGHKFNAVVKGVRFATINDELALNYQQDIDEHRDSIDNSVSELSDEPANKSSTSFHDSDPGEIGQTHPLSLGDQVELLWLINEQYHRGTTTAFDQSIGFHHVSYNDAAKKSFAWKMKLGIF